jgi:hypothetical protein
MQQAAGFARKSINVGRFVEPRGPSNERMTWAQFGHRGGFGARLLRVFVALGQSGSQAAMWRLFSVTYAANKQP